MQELTSDACRKANIHGNHVAATNINQHHASHQGTCQSLRNAPLWNEHSWLDRLGAQHKEGNPLVGDFSQSFWYAFLCLLNHLE